MAQFVQGLAALLVLGLNGSPPEAVVKMNPDWISQMGLQQSLTPSRNNGFFNMFKLMQQKSLELLIAQVMPQGMPRRHMTCMDMDHLSAQCLSPWLQPHLGQGLVQP